MDFIIPLIIILGLLAIIIIGIFSFFRGNVQMEGQYKIQAISIIGLTSIAAIALIITIGITDKASLVGVAGAAVGGIAGFLTNKEQKSNENTDEKTDETPEKDEISKEEPENKTALYPIEDQKVELGIPLEFTLSGISTEGYKLNFDMSPFTPEIPENTPDANIPKLNHTTGEFKWDPKDLQEKEYEVTFTLSDEKGGTDSRTIKISVNG